MDQLRELLNFVLVEYLPEPHGSLLTGILLGLRHSLPKNFYEALISTGTIHIVAASGFNISLIAKVLLDFSSMFFPKKVALTISYLGIVFYTILAGANPAVVRAAIMGVMAYTALFFGRLYIASWSLILTCLVMVLFDVSMLTSVSFWLSVASTAGILWLSPTTIAGVTGYEKQLVKYGMNPQTSKLEPETPIDKLKAVIWADFWTTIAAQAATLPIIVVVFGRISLISPLVNVLIVWIIPYIMLLGFLKLMLGLFVGVFGYLLGLFVFLPLEYMIFWIELSGKLPFNQINLEYFLISESPIKAALFCFGWYMTLLVYVSKTSKKVANQD